MASQTVGKCPLPVKFYGAEDDFLRSAHSATGVPMVELVRRGVRLMARQQHLFRSYGFILDLGREQNKEG
jgi:hypothetical protein